jgi:transcriptional regulator with PAS, ATPase and Fis domain
MGLDFKDLRESDDFLNALIDNITSAIFIVDRDFKVRNFNDPVQGLFQKDEDKILGEHCGNVIGCAFIIDQGKDCGETKNCNEGEPIILHCLFIIVRNEYELRCIASLKRGEIRQSGKPLEIDLDLPGSDDQPFLEGVLSEKVEGVLNTQVLPDH